MAPEHSALAETLYWDALSRGGIRRKQIGSVFILALFAASVAVLHRGLSGLGLALVCVMTLISGLLVIPALLCLTRARRVCRNVRAVTDCAAALAELQTLPTPSVRKTRVYGERFAYFFERGAVLEYAEVDHFFANWRHSFVYKKGRGHVYYVGAVLRSGMVLTFYKYHHSFLAADTLSFQTPPEVKAVLEELKQLLPDLEIDQSGLRR